MKNLVMSGLIALFAATLWSCNQNQTVSPDADASAARLGADSTGFFCRDSLTKVAVTALPATVTNYISANFAGATVDYAATDDAGNFLVAITQNDQRKALLFNADGTFNKELALRGGGRDRGGKGHGRKGGRGDRDSLMKVTIANLPAAITSYITTNYASATIVAAASDATRGYLVMIKQGTDRKTLLFNSDGTFTQEIVRGLGKDYTAIDASALPAAVTTYITTKYAGATIKAAGKNSTGQFKVVIQPTNGRTIDLLFAADGTFVQARKGH